MGALVALAATCLLVPAAGAAAKPAKQLTYAKYKVKVEGVQKTDWTYNHELQGHCDSNGAGGGSETVRFSSRPTKLKAYFGLAEPVTFFGGSKANPTAGEIPLRAAVTREGQIDHWGGEPCSYGDGTGGVPPAPDCGTKTSATKVELGFDHAAKRKLVLEQTEVADDPFANCAAGGVQWPHLIEANADRSHIGEIIEVDEMMKAGQYVVLAEGRDEQTEGDSQYVTTIRWSVNFKRVGGLRSTG